MSGTTGISSPDWTNTRAMRSIPIPPSIRVFSNESTLRVITIKRQKWRGENFPSCPRCQFSGLQLSFSAMKSIFFKNLSSFSGWDDLGYETTHLSKTPDLFFLLWGASQWVLIMFLGLQKYERLPTWTDCKQFFFFNASLSGCHERIIPEPSRCILLSVTSPAVITGFLFFFFLTLLICVCVSSSDLAPVRRWSTFWGPQSLGTASTIPRRAPFWRRAPGGPTSIRRPSLTSGGEFTTVASCPFVKISGTRTTTRPQVTR